MTEAVCAGVKGICGVMGERMARELHTKVLDIESVAYSTYFDAPSAARQIMGLVKAANRVAFAT